MLKRFQKGGLVIVLVLIGCGSWLLARAAEPPALAKLSGAEKVRVAKLIEGAKKEGKLVGYSAELRPDIQAQMIPKFREFYGLSENDLQINIVSIRSDAIITKVTGELRAKVYMTDFIHTSAIEWFNELAARGELMPYDSPEYKHYGPQSVNPELAPAHPPYFIVGAFNGQSIIYNPKYVKGEILQWKDVLRPEYKGKISCPDVSNSASHTEMYLVVRRVLDAGFFKELAKQDPFVLVSAQDLVNKAVSGEYPIIVMGALTIAFRTNLTGAGLKLVFPPEGTIVVGRQIAILARAPHPNASKLFMDFYHSETGQRILLDDGYIIGRLGMKSKYQYPRPIYEIKGAITMDWRKLTSKDRDNAREEFRRLIIEKK